MDSATTPLTPSSGKHTLWWIVGIIIIIVGGLIGYLLSQKSDTSTEVEQSAPQLNQTTQENPFVDGYEKEVPTNIQVTEAQITTVVDNSTAVNTPKPVATLKNFTITANNGTFSPSQIVVDKGDQVIIKFNAVDDEYDFKFINAAIGFYIVAQKGESKTFGFSTADKQAGVYVFSCGNKCGGNTKIEGELIIK